MEKKEEKLSSPYPAGQGKAAGKRQKSVLTEVEICIPWSSPLFGEGE